MEHAVGCVLSPLLDTLIVAEMLRPLDLHASSKYDRNRNGVMAMQSFLLRSRHRTTVTATQRGDVITAQYSSRRKFVSSGGQLAGGWGGGCWSPWLTVRDACGAIPCRWGRR